MLRPPNRVPEPVLARSVLVTITGVIAFALGREIDTSWIESALTVYSLTTPVIAAVLIRRKVTPIADTSATRRDPE